MRHGYLGLGSNVGDARANLQAAIDALPAHGVIPVRSSSAYRTEPVGEVLDQPDFLNACLEVRTALAPLELLDACKAVEREVGREAGGPRHGPRPIDVDVLLLGEETLRHDRLRIPHEEVAARRFVLVPLLELDPGLVLPPGDRPLAEALAALPEGEGRVDRVGPPLAVPGRMRRAWTGMAPQQRVVVAAAALLAAVGVVVVLLTGDLAALGPVIVLGGATVVVAAMAAPGEREARRRGSPPASRGG